MRKIKEEEQRKTKDVEKRKKGKMKIKVEKEEKGNRKGGKGQKGSTSFFYAEWYRTCDEFRRPNAGKFEACKEP